MNNYTLYPSLRGGGKTTWISRQVLADVLLGKQVAVVAHDAQSQGRFLHDHFRGLPVDVYCERTVLSARGRIYDQIYVDNADLFLDSPIVLCAHVSPGTPATFTYTPRD